MNIEKMEILRRIDLFLVQLPVHPFAPFGRRGIRVRILRGAFLGFRDRIFLGINSADPDSNVTARPEQAVLAERARITAITALCVQSIAVSLRVAVFHNATEHFYVVVTAANVGFPVSLCGTSFGHKLLCRAG